MTRITTTMAMRNPRLWQTTSSPNTGTDKNRGIKLKLFERALGSIVHKVIPGQTDLGEQFSMDGANNISSVSSLSVPCKCGGSVLDKAASSSVSMPDDTDLAVQCSVYS
jgi:hypothetical protein